MRVVFVRSAPLNLTPAVERYVAFLRKAGYPGELLGLELDFQPNRRPVEFVDALDSLRATYQTRLQRALMMLRWQLYQLGRLWSRRPEVVQICDVFSAAPALLFKWFHGAKLIYDVRDPAGMSLSHWGRLVSSALDKLESFTAARSDVVVMVSEPLKERLGAPTREKTIVIPNAPMEDRFLGARFSADGKLRINLAGFVSHRRNLEVLCEISAADDHVELDLYGAVYDEQTRQILERFGIGEPQQLSPSDALSRAASSDVVSLMYDPSIEVNRYAAPNKYYEALMLGKPVLCADGMRLAEEVSAAACGLSVPYGDRPALDRALAQLKDLRFRQRLGDAARRQWVTRYLGAPARARAAVYERAGVLAPGWDRGPAA
jgi:glycosyltransferase involved in cell wall biosynthesis